MTITHLRNLIAFVLILLLALALLWIAGETKAQGTHPGTNIPVIQPAMINTNDDWSVFITDVCVVDGMPRIISVEASYGWTITYQNTIGQVWVIKFSGEPFTSKPFISRRIYLGQYTCPTA